METVNRSFETLRRAVPSAVVYKKMSKVNIIHHAMEYIHQLMYLAHGEQLSPLPPSMYSPNPQFSPMEAHQQTFAYQQSLCSPNTFSSSPHHQYSQHSPSPYTPSPYTPYSSVQHPSPSLYSTGSAPQSSPALSGDSLHSGDIHRVLGDMLPEHRQLGDCRPRYGEPVELIKTEYQLEAGCTKLSVEDDDDVLDAIADWQSM